MVKTTTRTKTAVAIALTVISIGSMAAGLYYYGARALKDSSSNSAEESQKSASSASSQSAAEAGSQTVAVIGGDSSVKYGLAPINISQYGKIDADSTTLDSWCKKAGFDGATGLLTIGTQVIPDTAKSTAMLVASNEKIIEKIDSLGAKTYSNFGSYLKSCEYYGSGCYAQCYTGGKTIGAVSLTRIKTSINDYCKEKGYEGATGVVSSMGNKYIPQISSPAGGAEFDPASVAYNSVYWCAYASQVCFTQCYK